jgi:hypothetical protein
MVRSPLIRRACFSAALSLAAANIPATAVIAAQNPASSAPAAAKPSALSPSEMETFLLTGDMSRIRNVESGVTRSQRATLSDGRLTHDVHIQTIDDSKPVFTAGSKSEINFKDSYRYNIAGYRLARLMGLETVPMSVERVVRGKTAAVTWWVDDVLMDEKARSQKKTAGPNPGRTTSQLHVMLVWDELIQNKDRNQGNILWTSDWTMWLIDHTRAFRLGQELLAPNKLTRCERGLFERLKALTDESIAQAVGDSLTRDEREALLMRRDLIVKHFTDRIAKVGEDVVLFTLVGG